MDFFDLRTAYLIMGVLYVAMPAAIWLALRDNRTPAVHAWCLGGLLFALGLVLVSQRAQWPGWATFELANVLVNLGQVARVQALRWELKRPLRTPVLLGLPAAFLLAYEWGQQAASSHMATYLISMGSLGLYFAWIASLSLRIAREQQLHSPYWTCAVYVPLSLMALLNCARVALGLSDVGPLQSNWGTVSMTLLGNLTAVIGNTSFLGMYVERGKQRELATAREQARAAENAHLGQQIAQLERVRSMGMVSTYVVHELSQPLTSIQLIAEHAQIDGQQRPHDGAALRTHIEHILQQSRHAAQVLQRVRHFIAPGEAQHQLLTLQQIHAQVLGLLGNWLRKERVVVTITAAPSPARVMGDEVQLAQVLVNLYRNAINATAGLAERRIHVEIGLTAERAWLRVHDNGPGPSAQALLHTEQGQSFFGQPSGNHRLGVGWLICRKIAAQHQGHVRLRRHPAGGAVAELDLPRA